MKIAIVGTAQSANDAPIGVEGWKIWSLPPNVQRWKGIDKADEWFELHELPSLVQDCGADKAFFDSLRVLGSKLTVIEPSEEVPEAKLYPRQAIIDAFGPYFTSSIAWMLALAIQTNPETIGIWGVNCSGTAEYAEQRACIEYLIGIARGKGIKVQVHTDSMICKAFLYYDQTSQRITRKIKAMEDVAENYRDHANYNRGYVDALKFMKNGIGE
ncbi:hypothetical protein UFOVP1454_52 [uncultured Caudovirales phage]|uniref:Uncharacterized protein n=1 Tax=uncultured Caudovirales phage TaxID=2100421 RepID=A0A6J5SLB5_9CAUD|nr:hypothetical protein UFOVP1454_52 [uncultured Caudovirales phage]